ncbi:dixin isoform X4 [Lithobates pipiens]
MMIAYLARGSLQDILHEGFPEQQLQAYVAWVNSQLKKKAGVDPVQDLRLDLRDGVVLGHLIEIVAGEKLDGIHQQPNNTQEMKENVEQVLQFMASKKIRMHQTTSKDIVDGNLKSIMRIILTLAAHFKPVSGRSVNHNVQGATGKGQSNFSANHRPQSTTAMAQGAAAALADVRLDMSLSGRDISRYRQGSHSVEEEIGNPYWSVRAMVKQYEGHQGSASPSGSSGIANLVYWQMCGPLSWIVDLCLGLWTCLLDCGPVSWIVELCHGLWSCVLDCGAVSWIVELCLGLWSCVLDCGAVSWIVELCLGLWSCVLDCGAVSWIVDLCLGLWTCVLDCGLLSWIMDLHVYRHLHL